MEKKRSSIWKISGLAAMIIIIAVLAVLIRPALSNVVTDIIMIGSEKIERKGIVLSEGTNRASSIFDYNYSVNIYPEFIEDTDKNRDAYMISMTPILQNPELPNGCEIVSLATVLSFYGFDVDKVDLCDKYLTKGTFMRSDPDRVYVGDPKTKLDGLGCHSTVIRDSAYRYFRDMDRDYVVKCFKGIKLEDYRKYIDNDIPVIIWATVDMANYVKYIYWYDEKDEDKEYKWNIASHTLILIGYDKDNYIFCDPLNGLRKYDKIMTEAAYDMCGMEAMIIYPDRG